MTTFIYAVLALALFAASGWLFTQRGALSTSAKGAVTASVVVLMLAGIAALLSLFVVTGFDGDALRHGQRLFGLAARHMTVPVVGLAACFLMYGWQWKPMVWGQVILGLMGAFELARLLDASLRYEWLVNGLGLVALGWACFAARNRLLAILATAVGCLFAAALVADTAPLMALFRPAPSAGWLIPGLAGSALAVGVLADQAHNKSHVVPTNEPDHSPRS